MTLLVSKRVGVAYFVISTIIVTRLCAFVCRIKNNSLFKFFILRLYDGYLAGRNMLQVLILICKNNIVFRRNILLLLLLQHSLWLAVSIVVIYIHIHFIYMCIYYKSFVYNLYYLIHLLLFMRFLKELRRCSNGRHISFCWSKTKLHSSYVAAILINYHRPPHKNFKVLFSLTLHKIPTSELKINGSHHELSRRVWMSNGIQHDNRMM